MRVESEAALLGVVFTETGVMTGAPYRVRDATHWAFAGTGLATATSLARRACTAAARAGPRATRPTRSRPARRRAWSAWPKGRTSTTAVPSCRIYETPSGGAVFSAGSIAWPSAILVDDCVSQITANVLRRFS